MTEEPPAKLKRYVSIRTTYFGKDAEPRGSDRENCTVFVADLPAGVTEDELGTLFKDVQISPSVHRAID